MTELADEGSEQLSPDDLLRPPQEPIIFPNILRADRRWQQLPPGDVVYINATQPDSLPSTVTMLDQEGHPIQKHGHNWERPFQEPSRVPAVVIHTGARTIEEAYDEVVGKATRMLTRRLTRDPIKGVIEQNLGFVVIVEEKKNDGDSRFG